MVTDRQARHGLSPTDHQAVFDQLTGQGYRLTKITGHALGGTLRSPVCGATSRAPPGSRGTAFPPPTTKTRHHPGARRLPSARPFGNQSR